MRGADVEQGTLFSVVTLESRVPADHPLRKIRPLLDVSPVDSEAKLARKGKGQAARLS
jgi:hypothetical protein